VSAHPGFFLRRAFAFLALLLLTFCVKGFAQGGASGAVQGEVRDSSGALIAGAEVTLTGAGGGSVRLVRTNGEGSFAATLLPPGSYRVEVKAAGFAPEVADSIVVRVTETTRLSLALKPGAVATEVSVDAQVAAVNTSDASTGEAIGSGTIENLPLATRNFQQLLTLSTGTAASLNQNASLGRGDVRIEVNGQREDNNNYLIDGITATDYNVAELTNTPLPSPDAIGEFRVQTSLYDATQGRNGGGNINAILKTGTLQFHGSAFEFLRNTALDANEWFLKSAGQPRPDVKQNIFGGGIGGPVSPKGKLGFFYLNYQGTRQTSGLSNGTIIQSSIPVLPIDRSAQSLVDTFFPASLDYAPVTAAQIDPVALKLLNFKSNQFGSNLLIPSVSEPGTFEYSRPGTYRDDQVTASLDKSIRNGADTLSARYFFTNFESLLPFGAGGLTASLGGSIARTDLNFPLDLPVHDRLLIFRETHVFSPALVNEARFGYVRIHNASINTPILTASDLGIVRPNSNMDNLSYKFTFNSLGINIGPTPGADQNQLQNNLVASDTASFSRGRQLIRFGGEFDSINLDKSFPQEFNGQLFFSPSSGYTDFQNFLLGNPAFSYGGSGVYNHQYRAQDYALFAQDDLKLTHALTLNFGIRWELVGAYYDQLYHIGNTHADLARAGKEPYVYPRGINRYKVPGLVGTTSATTLDNNFASDWGPRFGFAYDLGGRSHTSIRGGYGIYYVREDVGNVDQLSYVPPILPMTFPGGTPGSLSTLFSTGGGQLPVGGVLDPNYIPVLSQITDFPNNDTTQSPNFNNNSINFLSLEVPRHFVSPSTQQWNLTVQQNLRHGWLLELGYIGTKGTHLRETRDAIQAYDVRQNPIIVTGAGGTTYTITQNTAANVNARSRAMGLGVSGYQLFADDANSNYHALQSTLTHRYANGLQVEAAYTWSKTIDETSTGNTAFNTAVNDQTSLKDSYGLSDFDRAHRLTLEYVYELPFLRSAHGLLKAAGAGWVASGITTFQSGIPITVLDSGAGVAFGLGGTGTPTTPELVGTVGQGVTHGSLHNRLNHYLDLDNFTFAPSAGSDNSTGFGNLGRNTYRGPFQQNWDLTLRKSFAIHEQQRFEFSTDFFNLWNHPVFSSPSFVDIESPNNFGQITSTQGSPRLIQFAGRISF
jgi:hypothetical protein